MGKATVLNCDVCQKWDSKENPVRTVQVGGPRFDLCAQHRVDLIITMGVDPRKARAYVAAFDNRETTRGSGLSLNGRAVREELQSGNDEVTPEEHAGQESQEPTLLDPQGGQEPAADATEETLTEGLNVPPGSSDQAADEYADQVIAEVTGGAHTDQEEEPESSRPTRKGRQARK